MMKINFLKSPFFLLTIIIIIGFWVRLYRIENPIADWHSWRQADTAAVARNFFKEGYNPFIPRYDDMSGVAQLPVPNKDRYRFVEFPIYNSLVYFTYLLNGGVDEKLARLVNIIISLGSLIFVYLLTKKYFGVTTGLAAALLFAILPYNIFFSRVILPEPILVFFSMGMVYFVDRWILENSQKLFALSILFTMCAFLTKPQAGFYFLPLLYSYYQKEKSWWPIPKRYWVLLITSILPFFGWRLWMSQFPQGIPASNWLLNGNGIRFKPIYFHWILQDRFGREILTTTGSILFFLGLFLKPKFSESWFLHLLALGAFLYLIVFATGNVQHDYYQTFIVPVLVIFTARGFILLVEGIKGFLPRIWTIPIAFLFLIMMLYTGWKEIKGLYQINNGVIVDAGRHADRILPKDAVVIAPYNGDTSFLYQTNRSGWPVVGMPIKDLIDGFNARYFISVNYDDKTNWILRKYQAIEKNPKYVIVDLNIENVDFDRENDPEPP